jgi:hypothetical protein
MSIELTTEQLQAAPVRVIDPETNCEYIVVRSELFDRLRQLVEEDVVATGELVDAVMADDDAKDPYLESYQSITRDKP